MVRNQTAVGSPGLRDVPPRAARVSARAPRCSRGGFTLTELMVVVFIILVLTILALPVVFGALRDRKLGEATRAIQGILAGARDRAIVSGRVGGVRLLRDEQDPWECTRLVYVGTPEIFSVGMVNVTGVTVTPDTTGRPDPHFEQVDAGKDNKLGPPNQFDDIPRVVPFGSYIRFNNSGSLILITGVNTGGPIATLTLAAAPAISTGPHTYQIFGPPVPRAQDKVQNLPDGIVIDLRGSPIAVGHALASVATVNIPRSRNLPFQIPPDGPIVRGPNGNYGDADDPSPTTWPPIEILFGPNGSVVGPTATAAMVHLWLGERGDKGPDPVASCGPDTFAGSPDDIGPTRPRTIVTLNTRTGSVQVYPNPGSAGTAARAYAEIYIPAEQMIGVSQVP